MKLQLSEYLVKTIKGYEKSGDIVVNKFVETSIANNTGDMNFDTFSNVIGSEYPENTLPLIVSLSKQLTFLLGLIQVRQQISVSDIAEEVLPLSLANLIADVQAQEDYCLEVELE